MYFLALMLVCLVAPNVGEEQLSNFASEVVDDMLKNPNRSTTVRNVITESAKKFPKFKLTLNDLEPKLRIKGTDLCSQFGAPYELGNIQDCAKAIAKEVNNANKEEIVLIVHGHGHDAHACSPSQDTLARAIETNHRDVKAISVCWNSRGSIQDALSVWENFKRSVIWNAVKENLHALKEAACRLGEEMGGNIYNTYAEATAWIGEYLSHFVREFQANGIKVHVIDQSLGAHVAGHIHKFSTNPKVTPEHVTGLDPAGPCFDDDFLGGQNDWGLDSKSAKFVDVYHTNDRKLGTHKPRGDVDIYVGNYQDQNGVGGVYQIDLMSWMNWMKIPNLYNDIDSHIFAPVVYTQSVNGMQCSTDPVAEKYVGDVFGYNMFRDEQLTVSWTRCGYGMPRLSNALSNGSRSLFLPTVSVWGSPKHLCSSGVADARTYKCP